MLEHGDAPETHQYSWSIPGQPVKGFAEWSKPGKLSVRRVRYIDTILSCQDEERMLLGAGYLNVGLVFGSARRLPVPSEAFQPRVRPEATGVQPRPPREPLPRLRLHDLRHTGAILAPARGRGREARSRDRHAPRRGQVHPAAEPGAGGVEAADSDELLAVGDE